MLFLSRLDLKKKLYWKKLFTFFNVVFATLLSPPDVFSQLVFLFILTVLFELIMVFSVLQSKLNKYIKHVLKNDKKFNKYTKTIGKTITFQKCTV